MGEQLRNSDTNRNPEVAAVVNKKSVYKKNIVACRPKAFPQSAYRHIALRDGGNVSCAVGQVAIFLLKVAALETVRRVSKSKCPPAWRGLQALQILCFPPFKWIKKWAPFKGLVKGVQMFSRPLLVLSVATAFSDQSDCNTETSDGNSDSQAHSETHSDSPSHPSFDARSNDGPSQSPASDNWLVQLHRELENQGIMLPERINEVELRRFYSAANEDFSCCLLSVKKTIRWRETYRVLSEQELEMWSKLVFWHGFDVHDRPCLIVRLGLACVSLQSHERPRFAQAVISQVEHGILHLVDEEIPQISVLVDCDGISPLRIPMQMIRSCSSLLQDNFPNRLGHLLVIRLPPVVRVIAQTFIQVLKPVTRKKLIIEGKMYRNVLFGYLQMLPSYLGGNCSCELCSDIRIHDMHGPQSTNQIDKVESNENVSDREVLSPHLSHQDDIDINDDWNRLLRTAVIGILMVWLFMALITGIYDPESRPF